MNHEPEECVDIMKLYIYRYPQSNNQLESQPSLGRSCVAGHPWQGTPSQEAEVLDGALNIESMWTRM